MNISKEQISDLNAVIKIQLQPEDYQSRVNEVIKSYQRNAKVPGFRPGKVPAGMIRKMYGKSVLVDELNKMLSEALGKYMYEEKLDIIGSPLPLRSGDEPVFEDGNSFEFSYEIGLAPSFEVNMPLSALPFYQVKVDDKMVEDDLNDIRRRYGKFTNPEQSDAHHILYGTFTELDEQGEVKEGGNTTTTSLALEMIKDAGKLSPFLGLRKDDTVKFNPRSTFSSEAEVAAMLRVDKGSPAMESDYQFKVSTINQIEKAELNQELFDKLYGAGEVSSEEQFRARIRASIASYFERESDRKLKKDVRLALLDSNSIALPDDFLKRMLKANQEKEMDEATFEHEYYHVVEDLRWNLIQNKLAAKHDVQINEEEIKELSRQLIRQQFSQYGYYDMEAERLDEIANRYMNEEGNYERLERTIRENKVIDILKQEVKLSTTELAYDDFVAKMKEKTAHEVEHHH